MDILYYKKKCKTKVNTRHVKCSGGRRGRGGGGGWASGGGPEGSGAGLEGEEDMEVRAQPVKHRGEAAPMKGLGLAFRALASPTTGVIEL